MTEKELAVFAETVLTLKILATAEEALRFATGNEIPIALGTLRKAGDDARELLNVLNILDGTPPNEPGTHPTPAKREPS